jgi:hypothetical protein
MNYRVRIVRGDVQFEAEGDKAFVLDLLKRFDADGPTSPKVSAPREHTSPPGAIVRGSSPGEFVRALGVKSHTDIVLAFGHYLEKRLDKADFTAADINNLYYEAKIENSNTSQYIINNIRRGFMMMAKSSKDGGRQRYTVTRSGEEHLQAKSAKARE